MNDYFIWNGINSLTKGVHVSEHPSRILPKERETTTKIPGRSGSLTTLEGDNIYDDVVLTCTCWIEDEGRIAELIPWLKGSGTVTFGNRTNGYYNARIANQISFDKILRGNPQRKFKVNFRCDPIFYLLPNRTITITTKDTFIENTGTMVSEPKVQVTLTGDAEGITIGSSVFSLKGVTGAIMVDTPKLECYKVSRGKNCTQYMSGEFPTIPQEGGYVTWDGSNVTKIMISPNFRTV